MIDERHDTNNTFRLDGSCSRDPDLPDTTGPSEQGLIYSFECHRVCQSQPQHYANWAFRNWDNITNPFKTNCKNEETSGSLITVVDPNGCFRPSFHVAGPLNYTIREAWQNLDNYPIKGKLEIDEVCIR